MGQTDRRTSAWPALAVVLAVSFSSLQPAAAADGLASEREQLAALARQLDLLDRLALSVAPNIAKLLVVLGTASTGSEIRAE